MEDHLTADELEALDPAPDIHSLFAYYNDLYFNGKLGACSVEWSTKRMTMCAGICCYSRTSGCRIKLSEPLLKYRPTRDLKDTLLHEMIHAELFLDGVRNDGDHGPVFQSRMRAINSATCTDHQRPAGGYHITVYHTMHDEVNLYRTHVWNCDRCGNTVKRSMNRPPQEADCRSFTKVAAAAAAAKGQPGSYCKDTRCWYHLHVKHCGGKYIKTSEPDKPANKAVTKSCKQQDTSSSSSNKRPKQPTQIAAANGMQSIETMFRKHNQQQQQQPQSAAADKPDQGDKPHGSCPDTQQLVQQHPDKRQEQLQVDQQQPVQLPSDDYWRRLGQSRTLDSTAVQQPASNQQGEELSRLKQLGESSSNRIKQLHDSGSIESSSRPKQRSNQQGQLGQQPLEGASLLQQGSQRQYNSHIKQREDGPAAKSNNSLLEAVEVVELLSSEDDDDDDGKAPGATLPQSQPMASVIKVAAGDGVPIVSVCTDRMGVDAVSVAVEVQQSGINNSGSGLLTCPVCCQEWQEGEISNEQLNAHMDLCLARMC